MAHSSAVEPLAYKVDDACVALGISRSKLYELCRGNKLKLVKLGTATRITATSLKALAEEGAA